MKIKNDNEQRKLLSHEFTGILEMCDGTEESYLTYIMYFKNGQRHREDGPAFEYSDGTKFWNLNGLHHREDGPAVEYEDGTKQWYLNGCIYTEHKWKIEVKKLRKNRKILSK
jgi:hypothetical protein